ncbi:MAG: ATP-binding protein [Desulfobacteraceae bacterium]|nr:ATP-binding protein [Desulfobacteraceae bacterium]
MIQRRPLLWQLYPAYLLLILAALLATGGYASHVMHEFHLTQVRQDLLNQAQLMVPRVQPLLGSSDTQAVDQFCKQTAVKVPTRITVILPDGRVLGDSETDPATMENHGHRPEIMAALAGRTGTAMRFSGTLGKRMMYLALPLEGPPVQGVVRVAVALTAVEQQLRTLQWHLGLGGLAVAVMAALLCLFISRRISWPLEAMRRSADAFAKGDLSHRLALPNTLELAGLAQAMNQMADELEQRIQSIMRQRNESEAVLSSMVEGVMALDSEERILHCNAAAARLLNIPGEQLQDRAILEVARNRDLHQMVRDTLAKATVHQGDVTLYQSGEQILHAHCTPLLDVDGRRMGAVLVMNDVTHLRRLETMRTDFAANVSHEIKTPLTAIQGFVETLSQGEVSDPQEVQRFLGITLKHVRRLAAIVDDLMKLARLEQGGESFKLKSEICRINDLLQAAVQVCRPKAEEKNIVVEIRCDEGLTARIDVDLMEQAIVNLLDNAIKYSPDGRRVQVTAKVADQVLQIDVRDNGLGIAARHLPRIFERFYRVDKARSRREGGTGLGLAIVKHIAQAHGGHVSVASEVGLGTTFTIHLPQ